MNVKEVQDLAESIKQIERQKYQKVVDSTVKSIVNTMDYTIKCVVNKHEQYLLQQVSLNDIKGDDEFCIDVWKLVIQNYIKEQFIVSFYGIGNKEFTNMDDIDWTLPFILKIAW